MGSCFLLLLFRCFFFACLFFSSQPKVSSLYPGYLRVSFSRTAGCFSVGRSLPKAETTSSEAAGHY